MKKLLNLAVTLKGAHRLNWKPSLFCVLINFWYRNCKKTQLDPAAVELKYRGNILCNVWLSFYSLECSKPTS